jgi:ABC-2 type transport system permease protein
MRDTLHAEWTKLRTAPGTGWLLAAAVALTVLLGALAATAVRCPAAAGCGQDPARVAFTGIQLGQAAVAILAVLMIGGEYGTGLIQITLAATPRRATVLAAKALVLSALVLATGTLAAAGSVLAGRLLLPTGLPLPLDHGAVLRATAGSVLYLLLIALLSLGVGTVVRESAVALGVVFGLLFLFPVLAAATSDPDWHRHLQQLGPMTAGLTILATTGLGDLPLTPWQGLGVLAAWTAGSLLAGGLLLRARDA